MCSCHSILEYCVMFSRVKLSIRSFVLLEIKNSPQSLPGQWRWVSQYDMIYDI